MERVTGRKVIDLLVESGALGEETVVTIGVQFARVLRLLHTELHRTYRDLKLENIWWDGQLGHIWVIDWNVFSEQVSAVDPRDDLERLARFVYQMRANVSIGGGRNPSK